MRKQFHQEISWKEKDPLMTKFITNIALGIAGTVLFSTSAFAQSPEWSRRSPTSSLEADLSFDRPDARRGRHRQGQGLYRRRWRVQKAELVAGSGSAILDKEALSVPAKVGCPPRRPARPR
jgi:protein TonB